MGYKQPPNLSIEAAGGLKPYVTAFFAKRGLSHTYEDVVTMIGYKKMRAGTKAKELDIVTATYKHWEQQYYKEKQNAESTSNRHR